MPEPGPKEKNLRELRARRETEQPVLRLVPPILPSEQEHVAWVLARARQLGCEQTVRMLLRLSAVP